MTSPSPVFCVAVCNFIPSPSLSLPSTSKSRHFLPFYVGERIQIISHCNNWCYGHFEGDPSQDGIFPSSFVEPVEEPHSIDEDELQQQRFSNAAFDGVEESKLLLSEITETLKSWWKFLKKDYSRGILDLDFKKYEESIKDLILIRKKILSGNVPTEELRELRHATAKKIDMGNHKMGLVMPIRDEASRILKIDNLSVIGAYREHERAYAKIISDNFNEIPKTSVLFIALNQVNFMLMYDCELTLLLWDNESKKALTESIVFRWNRRTNEFVHQNLNAMFVGLDGKEMMKDSLELAATITVEAPIDIAIAAANGKPMKPMGDVSTLCRQTLAQSRIKLADKLKDIADKEKRELRMSFHPLLPIDKFKANRKNELCIEFTIQRLTGESLDEIEVRNPESFNPKPIPINRLYLSSVKEIIEERRNEIHLKLGAADLHGGKYSDKNIEAVLKVYNGEGILQRGSFATTTPDQIELKDFHRSGVFCLNDRPIFDELIKIVLPSDLNSNLHLRILFYHRRTFDKTEKGPFAMAYLHLIHEGVLKKSASDELVIYKIEKYEERNVHYLRQPSTKTELKNFQQPAYRPENPSFILNEKNSLFYETTVLSAVHTTNPQLLSILSHREKNRDAMAFIKALIKSDEAKDELIKFLRDFCDALFLIMVSDEENTRHTVFKAIVHIIRICEDSVFQPYLDDYMESFYNTDITPPLFRALLDYLDIPSSAHGTPEPLLPVLRSLKYLTILIIKSQERHNECNGTDSPPSFVENFEEILRKLKNLVQDDSKKQVCQNTAIRFIPSMFQTLIDFEVFEPIYLANYVLDILERLSPNVITREKITFLSEIVSTDLFLDYDCCCLLLPKFIDEIVEQMDPCFPSGRNIRPDFDTETYLETAKLCANVLSDIVEKLFPFSPLKSVYHTEVTESLELIIFKAFRAIGQTVVLLLPRDPIRIRAVHALYLSLLDKFSTQIFINFLGSLPTFDDRSQTLMEMLQMFRNVLQQCPFPSEWYQMRYLQMRIMVRKSKLIMFYILLSKECELEMFIEFFKTQSKFLTVSSIVPTEFEAEIQFIRKTAAAVYRSMWFVLEPDAKKLLIDEILGDLLSVTFADDVEISSVMIPIFFDMLLINSENHQTFIQTFILHLDPQIDAGAGDSAFRVQFRDQMLQHCSNGDLIQLEFLEKIDRLLGLLLNLRKVKYDAENLDSGKLCNVQLINFYSSIRQNELYHHHLYNLYNSHRESGSDIEAGLTLLRFADNLQWSTDAIPEYIIKRQLNRGCTTQVNLREILFNEISTLFDSGEHWERAIEVLKQLIPVYERTMIDYAKLAELYRRIGKLYDKINKEIRTESYYFLVAFYGNGFPEYLANKKFVFRGEKLEMLGQFKAKMLGKFYGAQSIDTIENRSDLASSDGKFIQIIPVTPLKSGKSTQMPNGNVLMRWYYKHHDIYQFEQLRSERRDNTKWTKVEGNDATKLWIHRKVYTISNQLPDILNFASVQGEEEKEPENPVIVALRKIEEVNTSLRETAEFVVAGHSQYFIPLGGCIRGVLQADVGGGIKNYESFFSDEIKAEATPEELKMISRLRRLLLHHITILEYCLWIHASKPNIVNETFHAALVDLFSDYRRNVESKFGPAPSLLLPSHSIHLPASGALTAAAATSSQSFNHASSSSLSLDDSADKQSVLLRAVPGAATLLRSTMSRTKLPTPSSKKSTANITLDLDFNAEATQNSRFDAEMLQTLRELDSQLISPEPEIKDHDTDSDFDQPISPPPIPKRTSKLHSYSKQDINHHNAR